MSLPNVNIYQLVRLSFQNIESGASLAVDCIDRASNASSANFFPILREISGIGATISDQVPRQERGTITLINTLGTLGAERKISDLLQNHHLINREVIFYYAELSPEVEPTSISDFTEVWRAKVNDLSWANNLLRISVSQTLLSTRTITKVVTRSEFPNCPESSLGRHLPIIVGDYSEVDAVTVRSKYTISSENRIDIAYGTTLGNQFIPSGTGSDIPIVYMFNEITNRYEPITFVSGAFTPIYSQPITPSGAFHIGSVVNIWDLFQAVAYRLKPGQNVTGGEVICGVNWYLALSSGGDPNGEGQYTMTIYQNANGYPGREIAKSVCEINSPRKQFLGVFHGNNIYNFRFYLDRLVQIPIEDDLFIGLTRSDKDDNFSPFQDDGATGGGGLTPFEKYRILAADDGVDLASQSEWERVVTDQGKDHFDVWGIAVSHDLSGGSSSNYQSGLGHVQMTISMRDQDNVPDLERQNFIINSKGLRDMAGTVTGSAGSRISNVVHLFQTLMHEWTGASWASGRYSTTAFNDTWDRIVNSNSPYFVVLRGSTRGRTTQVGLLRELAYNTTASLVPLSNGQIGILFMGTDRPSTRVVEEEMARLVSIEIKASDNMVNVFQGVYSRVIVEQLPSLLSEGGFTSYTGLFDSRFNNTLADPALTNLSRSRFGDLEIGVSEFNFIGDMETMRRVASLYLRAFCLPSLITTIEVPLSVFRDLEMGSKIDVYMTGLPHEDGTTNDAQLPVNDAGTNPVEIINGHYYKRQQKYTFIIVGKTVTLGRSEQPSIRLTLLRVNQGALM
jgi:hypothetical protein